MITCCYECTDREVLCHSKCVKYISDKKAYGEKKEIIRKSKLYSSSHNATQYGSIMFNKTQSNVKQ